MHKIQSAIVLDCETGGLSAINNPICSIALLSISLYDGKEISRYESFVQPYGDLRYEDEAMKFTGITYNQLMNGKPLKEVVKDLVDEFQKANTANTHTKRPLLVGHNIGFDISFLLKAFSICKVDISKSLSCSEDGIGNKLPHYFDTMWLSRMKWGGDETMTKYNLGACCDKAGVSLTDAHSAMNDVVATKDLFISFMNSMRSNSGNEPSGNGVIVKNRPRTHFQF